MSEGKQGNQELRRIRRVLRETARLAKEASLTGSLQKGARGAAQQYNFTLEHLERGGSVPAGLFRPLAEDATFDEVGVAAAQLAGYIGEVADEVEQEQQIGRGRGAHGSHNVVNIGFGGLKELKELGQLLREQLPDWLQGKIGAKPEEEEGPNSLTEVESRVAEVGARLQAVAEQLRRGDLTDEQRSSLAEQLSQLGQEQARLARRHARLREAATTAVQQPDTDAPPGS